MPSSSNHKITIELVERANRLAARGGVLGAAGSGLAGAVGAGGIGRLAGFAKRGGAFGGFNPKNLFSKGIKGFSGQLLRATGQFGDIGTKVSGILVGGITKGLIGSVPTIGGALGSVFSRAAKFAAPKLAGGLANSLVGGIARSVSSLAPAIGKALGSSLSAGINIVAGITGEVLGALGNLAAALADKLSSLITKALKGVIGGALAIGVAGVVRALKLEPIEKAFDSLNKSLGNDTPDALEKLRKASSGTVSSLELMRNANLALSLSATESIDGFAKMVNIASSLSTVFGLSGAQAIDAMTQGLALLSARRLKEIGLTVTMEEAVAQLVATTKRSAVSFTDEEKAIAFRTLALKRGVEAVNKFGNVSKTASDKIQVFKTNLTEALGEIGKALLPVLGSVSKALEPLITRFRAFLQSEGPRLTEALTKGLVGTINALKDFGRTAVLVWDVITAGADVAWSLVKESGIRAFQQIWDFAGEASRAFWRTQSKLFPFPLGATGAILFPEGSSRKEDDLYRDPDRAALEASLGHLWDRLGDQFHVGATEFVAASKKAGSNIQRPLTSPETWETLERVLKGGVERRPSMRLSGDVGDARRSAGLTTPGSKSTREIPSGPFRGVFSGTNASAVSKLGAAGGLASLPEFLELSSAILSGVDEIRAAGEDRVAVALAELKTEQRIQAIIEDRARKESAAADAINRLELHATRSERRLADLVEERAEREKEYAERIKEAGKAFAEAVEDISAFLADAQQSLRDSVDSKVRDLAGIAGGLEPQGGLPLNVFKAIKKVRRGREKARFNQLRHDTQGLSSSDLAANDGRILQEVLANQAKREIGFASEMRAIFAEAGDRAAEAARERTTTMSTIAEESATFAAKFDSTFGEELDTLGQLLDALSSATSVLDGHSKALDTIQTEVSRIQALIRELEKSDAKVRAATRKAK